MLVIKFGGKHSKIEISMFRASNEGGYSINVRQTHKKDSSTLYDEVFILTFLLFFLGHDKDRFQILKNLFFIMSNASFMGFVHMLKLFILFEITIRQDQLSKLNMFADSLSMLETQLQEKEEQVMMFMFIRFIFTV